MPTKKNPAEPNSETIAQWRRAGAVYGAFDTLGFFAERPPQPGEMLGFKWPGASVSELADLPVIEVPFGLSLPGTDGDLAGLSDLKNLRALEFNHKVDLDDRIVSEIARLTELLTLGLAETHVSNKGLAKFAGLTKLTALTLWWCEDIGDKGMKALEGMPHLRTLDLYKTKVGDAGLKSIAGLKRLERLNLTETKIKDTGMASLAGLANLRELEVNCTRVGDVGLQYLAGLTQLETLDLGMTKVTSNGLTHLTGLQKLQTLDLSDTRVGSDGMKYLAALKSLRKLNLRSTQVSSFSDLAGLNLSEIELPVAAETDEAVIELADTVGPALTELAIRYCEVGDKAATALAKMTRLRKLDLISLKNLTDAGIAHLAALKDLRELNLMLTPITDKGLKHLAELRRLEKLWLAGTQVSDDGLGVLAELKELRELHVGGTKVSGPGVKHLAGLPQLEKLYIGGYDRIEGQIDDPSLTHISTLKHLKWLGLYKALKVTARGLKALKGLNLRLLQLPGHLKDDDGLKEMVAALDPDVEELDLEEWRITDESLGDVAKLRNLQRLKLRDTLVTDAGLAKLAPLTHLTELELGVSGLLTRAGAEGLAALIQLKSLYLPEKTDENLVAGLQAALPDCFVR